jgi:hypothetical protein
LTTLIEYSIEIITDGDQKVFESTDYSKQWNGRIQIMQVAMTGHTFGLPITNLAVEMVKSPLKKGYVQLIRN